MVEKDYWTDEDMTSVNAAIAVEAFKMSEDNIITINETDYNLDDFTDEQKTLLNHVQDLDRKIANVRFNQSAHS